MFRENKSHLQQSFFSADNFMAERIRKRLIDSWAHIFYTVVFCKIKEDSFSVLYCLNNGRPNFPINILISLEYIKHLFHYSDEELEEQFCFNYQVSYAVGVRTMGETALCFSTLYEFRRKIYQYLIDNPENGDLIFGQFVLLAKEFERQANISTEEQRMDSTMILANVKNAGRLALAFDVIEKALKVVPVGIMTDAMKQMTTEGHRKQILYKSKGTQIVARIQEMINLGHEIVGLAKNMPEISVLEEIQVLRRFISEQTKVDKETGEIVAKNNKEIKADSLQSAYDTDATYRKKGDKAGKGYSVNICETCNSENPVQLITHYDVKPNIADDVTFAAEGIPEIKENFDLKDLYLDGGYCGDDVRNSAEKNEVILHYTDMTGKKVDPDKFTARDFEFNEDNTVNVCPANIKPLYTICNQEKGTITAHFAKKDCETCELREKCCIKEQKKTNKLSTNEQTLKLGIDRENMLNERKENTSKRASIEGSNSELKRKHGLNDVRVRGLVKVIITTGLKITACNFKRFAKYTLNKLKENAKIPKIIRKQGIVLPN